MLPTSPLANPTIGSASNSSAASTLQAPETSEDSKMRFEQLLWAELLTHTGLEAALTLGGGQGAAMFSRYFVEAIAADIAKQHPLGLLDGDIPTSEASTEEIGGESNG